MDIELTLAQVNPVTGDLEGNTERILDEVERAEGVGADVVVFPELAITGYCIRDLIEDETFVDENWNALHHIRRQTGETAVVIGVIDRDQHGKYNAVAVLQHGSIRGVARKTLLPNYRYFDDERYFEPGDEAEPIAVEVRDRTVQLGVTVCEDMWDGEYDRQPVTEVAEAGADLLLNVNASPFEVGKRRRRHDVIQRHVEETGLPFLYVNTAGVADVEKNVLVFDGDSLAYAADGTLLEAGEQFGADSIDVTVETPGGDSVRYSGSTVTAERWEKELYEALVFGVRDYARKAGFDGLIEPVSGGIDSSLGLAICAEAVGPENVLAFNLPSDVNTEATIHSARTVTENFGVRYRTIPVQSIYDEVLTVYEDHVGAITTDTARENVYARVRGLLMMLASNDSADDSPAMLVTNGNETEMALGYATLYGDMSGGLDVLGDLSKTEVYDVARYVNERHGAEMIPEQVFEAEPSAELTEDHVDPFDYSTVSPVVDDLLEQRLEPTELVARFENGELETDRYSDRRGRSVYDRYTAEEFEETVFNTYRRLTRTTFKRVQSPPIIAVSRRAFGTDFREPILNEWHGRPLDWE